MALLLILTNRKYSFQLLTTFGKSLCDHYHLMNSILKTTVQKEERKILIYHYFEKFTYTDFQSELISKPNSRNSYEYRTLEIKFCRSFTHACTKKRKILLDNHKPHVNKTLNSAILKCSQLKSKAM